MLLKKINIEEINDIIKFNKYIQNCSEDVKKANSKIEGRK